MSTLRRPRVSACPMSLFTVSATDDPQSYVHHLSFTIEKALPGNLVVKAGYAGKLAHDLLRMNQINPARYIPGQSTVANTDSRRLYIPGSFRQHPAGCGEFELQLSRAPAAGEPAAQPRLTVTGSYRFRKFLDYYFGHESRTVPAGSLQHACGPFSLGQECAPHVTPTVRFITRFPCRRAHKASSGKDSEAWTLVRNWSR